MKRKKKIKLLHKSGCIGLARNELTISRGSELHSSTSIGAKLKLQVKQIMCLTF